MKKKRKRREPLFWQRGSDGYAAFTPANGLFIIHSTVSGFIAHYVGPSRTPDSAKLLGRFASEEKAMAYCDLWWRAGRGA